MLGRTAAIEMASYLIGPYSGNVDAGLAARMMGLGPSVAMGGVLCGGIYSDYLYAAGASEVSGECIADSRNWITSKCPPG